MKKLMLIMLAVLMLAGCTKTVVEDNKAVERTPAEVLDLVADKAGGKNNYLGSGIYVSSVAGNDIRNTGEISMYTVFLGDYLTSVLIFNDGRQAVVTDEGTLMDIENALNREVSYVEAGGEIWQVTANKIMTITGTKDAKATEEEEKAMKKMQKSLKVNPLGIKKIRLYERIASDDDVTDPDTGIKYSNRLLVVKLKDGDKDKMVSEFETFVKGKLSREISGLHVFEITPSSYTVLVNLMQEARENMDFIEDIFLDEVKEPMDGGGVKPVTE